MIHINRFLDKITSAEAKKLKQVNMSIEDAKGLHTDITKLLLHIQENKPKTKSDVDKVQKIEIAGGKW